MTDEDPTPRSIERFGQIIFESSEVYGLDHLRSPHRSALALVWCCLRRLGVHDEGVPSYEDWMTVVTG